MMVDMLVGVLGICWWDHSACVGGYVGHLLVDMWDVCWWICGRLLVEMLKVCWIFRRLLVDIHYWTSVGGYFGCRLVDMLDVS